jgi:hypothetical protein
MGDYKKGDRLMDHLANTIANRRFSEQADFRHNPRNAQYLDEENLNNHMPGNMRHQTPTARPNFRAMANNTTLSDNASQNSGNNNLSMSHVRSARSKGIILARVGYEWKAIYKRLTRIDKGNTGLVTMK